MRTHVGPMLVIAGSLSDGSERAVRDLPGSPQRAIHAILSSESGYLAMLSCQLQTICTTVRHDCLGRVIIAHIH